MTFGHFAYRDDGEREAFDPKRVSKGMAGCLLCARPIVGIGIFTARDEETYRLIVTLRRVAIRPGSLPGLLYGLCAEHAAERMSRDEARVDALCSRVEEIFAAMASRMGVH